MVPHQSGVSGHMGTRHTRGSLEIDVLQFCVVLVVKLSFSFFAGVTIYFIQSVIATLIIWIQNAHKMFIQVEEEGLFVKLFL